MTERDSFRSDGFTLIEMVVTMTILVLVVAMAGIFMRTPIDSYLDATRRAATTDIVETALRRISRDVSIAIPNSVRVNGQLLEFLPTKDGGRYRAMPDALSGLTNILDFDSTSPLDTSFEILQPPYSTTDARRIKAETGDYLVIFNTGQRSSGGTCATVGADVYQGCNRRVVSATATSSTLSFSTPGLSLPFPLRSESSSLSPPQPQRFQIAPSTGPVLYACESVGLNSDKDGTGTLKRYTSYQTNAAADWGSSTTHPSTTGALLANYVSECSFVYNQTTSFTSTNSGSLSYGATEVAELTGRGLIVLRLTITRRGEPISLVHQIHVNNLP